MSDAQWWYERNGQPAGPVPFPVLRELAAKGDVKPSTLVWASGMPAWARAETVALLTFARPDVRPPPLTPPMPPAEVPPMPPASAPTSATPTPPTPGAPSELPPATGGDTVARDRAEAPLPTTPVGPSGSGVDPSRWGFPPTAGAPPAPDRAGAPGAPTNWLPQQRPATAAGAVAEPGELNVATTLLLSVVTLGIFGAIQFFHTVRAYERLSGRETRFALYFWIFVGCVAGGMVLHVLLPLLGVGALVFEFLALAEALRARRDAMAAWQLTPAVASENTHWLYLGLGTLLAPLLVGLVFLLLQAKKWFEDWNAIRRAAIARG